ncbi:MAG: preprotein translocase subunit SecE [Oscillospiraceae bacterium]|nr:preprotein translocase subunit SecE [Oscillospiraceae bacterium]
MSKDEKKLTQDEKLAQLDDEAAYEAMLAEEEAAEKEAAQKAKAKALPAKHDKKKPKKANWFVRFCKAVGKKFKDTFAELRKVTWPSFPKVMKQTGIVVAVVLFFLVVIYLDDLALSQLYALLFQDSGATLLGCNNAAAFIGSLFAFLPLTVFLRRRSRI